MTNKTSNSKKTKLIDRRNKLFEASKKKFLKSLENFFQDGDLENLTINFLFSACHRIGKKRDFLLKLTKLIELHHEIEFEKMQLKGLKSDPLSRFVARTEADIEKVLLISDNLKENRQKKAGGDPIYRIQEVTDEWLNRNFVTLTDTLSDSSSLEKMKLGLEDRYNFTLSRPTISKYLEESRKRRKKAREVIDAEI